MVEESMIEKKVLFKEKFSCPHCKGKIIVTKERKLLNNPVKPMYDDVVSVKKDTQKTLDANDFGKTK